MRASEQTIFLPADVLLVMKPSFGSAFGRIVELPDELSEGIHCRISQPLWKDWGGGVFGVEAVAEQNTDYREGSDEFAREGLPYRGSRCSPRRRGRE
jgi:hypothetical protein